VHCGCVVEAIAGPDGMDARQGPPQSFPISFDEADVGSPLPAAGNDYTR